MVWLRIFSLLTRLLTVMVCWMALMGVPMLFFQPPLKPEQFAPLLAVFYTTQLVASTWVARSWGGAGPALVGLPFMAFFTVIAVQKGLGPDPWAAWPYLGVYPVAMVAWRLGLRFPSAARDHGTLLPPAMPSPEKMKEEIEALIAAERAKRDGAEG